MTRIKVCGITRPDDAIAAAAAGVDAIGCIFYPASPRGVDTDEAKRVLAALPPFVSPIAVVVDPEDELLDAIMAIGGFSAIQFHGDELPSRCEAVGLPYIKAVRVREQGDVERAVEAHSNAQAFLLDTYRPGLKGGTGERFDWSLIPLELGSRIVLSGGLSAANVAEAIDVVRPYAVDVSSSVESQPGLKDHQKINDFVREVKRVSAA